VRQRTLGCIPSLLVAGALALAACGGSEAESDPGAAPPSTDPAGASAPGPVAATAPVASRPGHERPLPEIAGTTLDGKRAALSDHLGRRLLLFFFNPEVEQAAAASTAVKRIAAARGAHNFAILGVAIGSNGETARRFASEQQLDFAVIDDSGGAITRQLGLRSPVMLLGADGEGYYKFGFSSLPEDPEIATALLEEALRLRPTAEAGTAEARAPAPNFSAAVLDGAERFEFAAARGRPVLLVFFLHTCPHCHDALGVIKKLLAPLPAATRPRLVGVEVSGRTADVRQELKTRGLDFFPVLFDDDGSIRASYGVHAGVPDLFLIDAEGRIAQRMQGWHDETDPPLLEMRLAKLVGGPVPMLLRTQGYSGNQVCGVCHESEHATWELTAHAGAYATLVRHAADANAECVSCHVVGFGQQGGYQMDHPDRELEGVGCESCHGRGGPHLSPDFAPAGNYASACIGCHNPQHSLGFDYATFLPRISHAANRPLLALPAEEKAKLLAERGRPQGLDALTTNATIVGSEACRSCHAAEFETWSQSAHAHARETLAAKGKAGDAGCLRCHTTGMGRPGGFDPASGGAAGADLARVGCESCHGPGSAHVAENATRRGTILSLGDKCDSCVILQICGSCHDEANDPGFEFSVKQKIDAQRHGTIEAGTGKPKPATSAALLPPHAAAALAFHELERSRWTAR